jgi:hypothetical protein
VTLVHTEAPLERNYLPPKTSYGEPLLNNNFDSYSPPASGNVFKITQNLMD